MVLLPRVVAVAVPLPGSMTVLSRLDAREGAVVKSDGEIMEILEAYDLTGSYRAAAGLFAPIGDVLRFADSFLDGRLLSEPSLEEMTRSALRPHHGSAFGHGLGVRIGDSISMGSAHGFGHTGFTGTLWIADPESGLTIALLTNRVYPDRSAIRIAPFRARFIDVLRRTLGAPR